MTDMGVLAGSLALCANARVGATTFSTFSAAPLSLLAVALPAAAG